MTAEEQAAADAAAKAAADEKAKAEAASAAAAELARRKAEKAAASADEAPVRMVDLHDVRAELRGELEKVRQENVRHAVPEAPAAPAQRARGSGVVGGIIGGLVVVLLLVAAIVAAGRK